ncbi:hypothetical protein F442_04849, partial [Phytophthora nicotianae P10297]
PPSVEEASHDQLDHQVTISRQQQVNAVMIPSLWVFLTSLFQPRVFFTSVLYSSQFPIRLQVPQSQRNRRLADRKAPKFWFRMPMCTGRRMPGHAGESTAVSELLHQKGQQHCRDSGPVDDGQCMRSQLHVSHYEYV